MKFRGDSGLEDGKSAEKPVDLTGGFYDSGNNIKFTFTTAYTVTLLSWTVIEYQGKYSHIGELDHVRDVIKWGSDYLLKVFVLPNATARSSLILYSQASDVEFFSTTHSYSEQDNRHINSSCYFIRLEVLLMIMVNLMI